MNAKLNKVLDIIGEKYKGNIQKGSRHYLEVSIGKQAEKLGHTDLHEKYINTYASGIAVPGYLAREDGRSFKTFAPNDSMICNFT